MSIVTVVVTVDFEIGFLGSLNRHTFVTADAVIAVVTVVVDNDSEQ